jgi:hypothetical protein
LAERPEFEPEVDRTRVEQGYFEQLQNMHLTSAAAARMSTMMMKRRSGRLPVQSIGFRRGREELGVGSVKNSDTCWAHFEAPPDTGS